MATQAYLTGRKKYSRPQAMLWSENYGTLQNGFYVPSGYEIGANDAGVPDAQHNNFLILSDHNRTDLSFSTQRIQNRQRMINGSMRSYHVADKIEISTSWNNLPSKSYSNNPSFDSSGNSDYDGTTDEYTVDGGAGGLELLDWYDTHSDPFWVFLAYDRYDDRTKYTQIVQMYIKDFSYNVIKRSALGFDLWNVSVSLEEV